MKTPANSHTKATLALLFALLAGALHSGHLLYLSRAQGCTSILLRCPEGDRPWSAGDYGTYWGVAQALRAHGILGSSYIRRTPGYPLLLLASSTAFGTTAPARWVGPALAAGAAFAIVWLALEMAGTRRSGIVAGVLALGWLSSYCFSAALQPDGPHAFLVVMAIAATVHWRRYKRLAVAGLAGALFVAAQLLRPTLHPLFIILPLLLHQRGARRRYTVGSALLWGTTVIVPVFVIGSNAVHHGVATPSHVMAVNLRCYTVPRIQSEQGVGSFRALRSRCLERFQGIAPRVRIPQQIDEATRFLGNHPRAAVRSFAGELTDQLLEPIRLADIPARTLMYPRFLATDLEVLAPFWGLALLGILGVGRRDPALATFALGLFALVMLPATTAHLTGGRLRLPLDLAFTPFAAIGLCRVAAWCRRIVVRPNGSNS